MKDAKSILLVVVSLCLIGTWVFHIYDKSKYASLTPESEKKDTLASIIPLNDSIQQLYQSTVLELQTLKSGNDSLDRELQYKSDEIDILRQQITRILDETDLTREDLKRAFAKIQELQKKIQQYNLQRDVASKTVRNSISQPSNLSASNNSISEPSVRVSEMNMQIGRSSTESEDEFLTISFQVRNINNATGTAPIYLVVKDPSGNTIQDDEWSAGAFNSKNEGMIRYSKKLAWDYKKGDNRKLSTTLPVNSVIAGSYQLQLYCNDLRIGKTNVKLK